MPKPEATSTGKPPAPPEPKPPAPKPTTSLDDYQSDFIPVIAGKP